MDEAERRVANLIQRNMYKKELELMPTQEPYQIKEELEKPSHTKPAEEIDRSINVISGLAYIKNIIHRR